MDLVKLLDQALTSNQIEGLKKELGPYAKITLDLESGQLVIGCPLHADGEKVLLEKGAKQDNIWGGGINFVTKEIDTFAVLNLRPNLNNNSLEIIDPQRREKFIKTAKKIFSNL